VPRADGAVDGPSVLAGLDGRLARFKQPKAVFVVHELPRNAMAKVQKSALRDEYGATFE
jgi:malonyl-CoA/methylmalonyl-CoA synthetase